MEDYSVHWNARNAAGVNIARGKCVVKDANGEYVIATAANRAALGGKPTAGLAKSEADSINRSFGFQFVGVVPKDLVPTVGVGAQDQTVYVNANGDLARGGVDGVDDIVGYADADGTCYVLFGGLFGGGGGGGGGSFVPPTGDGFIRIVAGVMQAAASAVNLAGGATHITGLLPLANLTPGGNGQFLSVAGGVATWVASPATAPPFTIGPGGGSAPTLGDLVRVRNFDGSGDNEKCVIAGVRTSAGVSVPVATLYEDSTGAALLLGSDYDVQTTAYLRKVGLFGEELFAATTDLRWRNRNGQQFAHDKGNVITTSGTTPVLLWSATLGFFEVAALDAVVTAIRSDNGAIKGVWRISADLEDDGSVASHIDDDDTGIVRVRLAGAAVDLDCFIDFSGHTVRIWAVGETGLSFNWRIRASLQAHV